MVGWWSNFINNYFGSNVTHVTNAYSRADECTVCFSAQEIMIESMKVNSGGDLGVTLPGTLTVNTSGSLDVKFKKSTTILECVHLPYHGEYRYYRDTPTINVTVVAHNRDGTFKKMWTNAKLMANRSIIIADDGVIRPQAYGKNIWVDESGYNHFTNKQEW